MTLLARTLLIALMILGAAVRPPAAAGQAPCDGAYDPLRLRMLLEKTIFNIDVLWLTVDIRGEHAARLRTLSRDLAEDGDVRGAAADSVAWAAVDAKCADARLDFVRGISRRQLVNAIRESTRAAWEAGMIEEDTYRFVERGLPDWYPFLEERGVREGDAMRYRIRGDTLNIRYRAADGRVLLDRTDVGTARSVLAGYFAPGSDFREGLLRSLLEAEGETPRGDVWRPEDGS